MIKSPPPLPDMNTYILINRTGCALRQFLYNIKEVKALAQCDITPESTELNQSVLPDGYCRTVRRGLHSATVTQL
jgi:hypothetical protein